MRKTFLHMDAYLCMCVVCCEQNRHFLANVCMCTNTCTPQTHWLRLIESAHTSHGLYSSVLALICSVCIKELMSTFPSQDCIFRPLSNYISLVLKK